MDDINVILETFPFLVPSSDFKMWNGFIYLEDEEIPVTLATPHFPSLENISVICSVNWERKLQEKLKEYDKLVDCKTNQLLDLLEYFKNTDVIQNPSCKVNQVDGKAGKTNLYDKSELQLDHQLYNRILEELKQLGGDKVVWCSGDLSRISLRVVDMRGVEHRVVVGLAQDYLATGPTVIDADLPDVALQELSQNKTIIDIFNNFEHLVETFQEFWTVYEDLKKNTWLIDPENPQLRDVHCRIVIGENVSMLITLNPQDVNTIPDIKFLGPENLVTPFINSMENKLKTIGWNEDMSVLENLLSLLELSQFPQPDLANETVVQHGECSICFVMRLEDQALPIKVCNNVKCDSYFHISCLAQWFQAVPTNESSFNLISGSCPCCGERILCPVTVT